MKAVVAAFNQEKALVGAFSVITNLRMELFQALVRWPQPGLSLRHPPASEKLFMKPIPSHRIQSCEDGVDIISFIFFSFAARARGPPSPCLNLAASLSIRTHFLPTLPQFSQFYSHSSLHNHVCHYTFSNAFSYPLKREMNV